jgi:hypothetical protein
VQLNPIQRRSDDLPPTVRNAHQSPDEGDLQSSLASLDNTNWVLDLPDSLVEIKDFHFAISASFRMARSMGDEFFFDEVR